MRYLFNGGWTFLETDLSADYASVQAKKDLFKKVELPHDWLIYESAGTARILSMTSRRIQGAL